MDSEHRKTVATVETTLPGHSRAYLERENRLHEYLASSEERMRKLGEQLRAAEAELAKRDLTTLSTGRLLSHVESLRRQLRREAGPMQFVSTVDAIPEDEYADRIQVWNP